MICINAVKKFCWKCDRNASSAPGDASSSNLYAQKSSFFRCTNGLQRTAAFPLAIGLNCCCFFGLKLISSSHLASSGSGVLVFSRQFLPLHFWLPHQSPIALMAAILTAVSTPKGEQPAINPVILCKACHKYDPEEKHNDCKGASTLIAAILCPKLFPDGLVFY